MVFVALDEGTTKMLGIVIEGTPVKEVSAAE
jgi:hypothetical protein